MRVIHKPQYRRRKPPITLAPVHDRKALDPPIGTEVIAQLIDDPWPDGGQKSASFDRRKPGAEGEWLAPGADKIVVLRSIRCDPLGWMHSHGRLDEAEYLAGRHWQLLYERSHLGSVQAVDTTKEPVDGGQMPDLLTDVQRAAIQTLAKAERALTLGYDRSRVALVRDVLGAGMFVTQAAAARGLFAERQIAMLSREFTAALSSLAVSFGFATEVYERPKRNGREAARRRTTK